jgi:predicted ATPase
MKSELYWQVYERLLGDEDVDPVVAALVEAGFESADAVRAALEGDGSGLDETSIPTKAQRRSAPTVWLESLDVTGFRGIGPTSRLDLEPGPGLTVVVGRNGSGKSSFAEGLEVLLTGESLRWKRKGSKEWLGGWKNLHHTGKTYVRGRFTVEGEGRREFTREWTGDEFDVGRLLVDGAAAPSNPWNEALDTFRPILSYNEIGATLEEGPSHLYDLLSGVLGMEELTAARDVIAAVRKEVAGYKKTFKTAKSRLERELEKSQDERVSAVREAIKGRKADIDALVELALDEGDDDSLVSVLRRVEALRVPTAEDVLAAVAELREAEADFLKLMETAAGEQSQMVKLLQSALHVHDEGTSLDCPVCGEGTLDDAWRASTQEKIAAMEEATERMKQAAQRRKNARQAALKRVNAIGSIPDVELEARTSAAAAKASWEQLGERESAEDLARGMESEFDGLEQSFSELREAAAEQLRRLNTEWRPVKTALDAFIEAHAEMERQKPREKACKDAESWIADANDALRADRFTPIRDRAVAIWETLRHQSNVSLDEIKLEGVRTSRRVTLDVTVDGTQAAALGVMSQGELHAMLLSLFLPRMTLDESPFRFLVVDDPVQAMDPAKVDGLAQVLHEVAQTRQVVVFTHDARLPEAIRRMQLPATVLEVRRREESQLDLRTTRSRARQFLDDAWTMVDAQHKFGPSVAPRVVPGLCRAAMEAEFERRIWTSQLAEKKTHAEIADLLENKKSLYKLGQLALTGGDSRDLYGYLSNKIDSWAVDTFKDVNEGAHGNFSGDVRTLVSNTQQLLRELGASV